MNQLVQTGTDLIISTHTADMIRVRVKDLSPATSFGRGLRCCWLRLERRL